MAAATVTSSADVASGKGHKDENFPVASHLIAARHRPAIMAFYEFVRAADDVADNAVLTGPQKLAMLDSMEASLLGRGDAEAVALPLRRVLAERRLSPRHAQDLLDAFRLDVTKHRTANWAELMHYCSLSAMPVGRFVLDVHGEPETTWPASDAICAALQIINHLQDCGADYRDLDRTYVPLDALARAGLGVEALGGPAASPALRGVFGEVVAKTRDLLEEGASLTLQVTDLRVAMEIAAIVALARRLIDIVAVRDPLSEPVHLGKGAMLRTAAWASAGIVARRLARLPARAATGRPRDARP